MSSQAGVGGERTMTQWESSSSSSGGVKERREERVGGFGAWTRGVGGWGLEETACSTAQKRAGCKALRCYSFAALKLKLFSFPLDRIPVSFDGFECCAMRPLSLRGVASLFAVNFHQMFQTGPPCRVLCSFLVLWNCCVYLFAHSILYFGFAYYDPWIDLFPCCIDSV